MFVVSVQMVNYGFRHFCCQIPRFLFALFEILLLESNHWLRKSLGQSSSEVLKSKICFSWLTLHLRVINLTLWVWWHGSLWCLSIFRQTGCKFSLSTRWHLCPFTVLNVLFMCSVYTNGSEFIFWWHVPPWQMSTFRQTECKPPQTQFILIFFLKCVCHSDTRMRLSDC